MRTDVPYLYRVRIVEDPEGALQPKVVGKPGDCEVRWLRNPNWTPPGWSSSQSFRWPDDGKPYQTRYSAERRAHEFEEYGATVVIERSGRIIWPDEPGLPEQLPYNG